MQAALIAARELTGPIIAMTIVLIAVYVPIGFQGGLTGALFTEFAFTLAGAVTVSAILALTLSPMMCSRFLRNDHEGSRFVKFIDRQFDRLHKGYERRLHSVLETWIVMVVMGAMIFGGASGLASGLVAAFACVLLVASGALAVREAGWLERFETFRRR